MTLFHRHNRWLFLLPLALLLLIGAGVALETCLGVPIRGMRPGANGTVRYALSLFPDIPHEASRCPWCQRNGTLPVSDARLKPPFVFLESRYPSHIRMPAGRVSNSGKPTVVPFWLIAHAGHSVEKVNERGDMVGWYVANPGRGAVQRAFLWTGGRALDLGVEGELGGCPVLDINSRGEVAGTIEVATSSSARWPHNRRVFLWRQGHLAWLKRSPNWSEELLRLNRDGDAVVKITRHFDMHGSPAQDSETTAVWRRGKYEVIPQRAGPGIPVATNDLGHILRRTIDHAHLTILQTGTRVVRLPEGCAGEAFNNADQVIGWAVRNRRITLSRPRNWRDLPNTARIQSFTEPMLWTNGQRYFLNDLIPRSAGIQLTRVVYIDDAGRIAVEGRTGRVNRKYLLTPVGP